MKYYHGTKSQFKEFSLKGNGKHGEGFYFTGNLQDAKQFALSLAGIGGHNPQVIIVHLKCTNLFNTLNPDHASIVMDSLGLNYKVPTSVGEYGANEHYDHLIKQLLKSGFSKSEINNLIQKAGFDGLIYDFMDHVIVFDENLILIEEFLVLE